MNHTPHQKNIIHGSITVGGNVHIGDIIYNIEQILIQKGKILRGPKSNSKIIKNKRIC
jgi:ribosomal protein L2